ncbi:hypothetical protein ACG7TL_008869 [Trametes sanguinea]
MAKGEECARRETGKREKDGRGEGEWAERLEAAEIHIQPFQLKVKPVEQTAEFRVNEQEAASEEGRQAKGERKNEKHIDGGIAKRGKFPEALVFSIDDIRKRPCKVGGANGQAFTFLTCG